MSRENEAPANPKTSNFLPDNTHKKKKRHLTPEDLKTGFGLHTDRSLELAIRKANKVSRICICKPCISVPAEDQHEALQPEQSKEDIKLETFSSNELLIRKELKYLLAREHEEVGEEEYEVPSIETPGVKAKKKEPARRSAELEFLVDISKIMSMARQYLEDHMIFELFQFLITHLLVNAPRDPIDFLVNLLDKCLIYRTGISDAPLLYQQNHIECLFNLMDRMQSGFIDQNQLKTGMMTLGLKLDTTKHVRTKDKMVSKEAFVKKVHDCLLGIFNEMIRKRPKETDFNKKAAMKNPPPSAANKSCIDDSFLNMLKEN